MHCISPTEVHYGIDKKKTIFVPCKKCIPCKINKTTEWSMRLMYELQDWKDAVFLTLTYDQEHLPENKSLVKEDIKAFWKALRQNLDGRQIKYFCCGEYGDPDGGCRPHYHAIVFGLSNSLSDRKAIYDAWLHRCAEFMFFGSEWKRTVGDVTVDSCNYVAGYCQKKLFGEQAEETYTKTGRIPPFQLQSNGIGEKQFLANIETIKQDGFILFRGKKYPVPEIWKRKFNIQSSYAEDLYYETKKEWLKQHPEDKNNTFSFRSLSGEDVTLDWFDMCYKKFGFTPFQDKENYKTLNNYELAQSIIRSKNNLKKGKVKL